MSLNVKSDPTSLKNVLNALQNSSRLKHWDKPPRDYGPDNPEDSEYNTNGLKWVGDMSKITLSPGFSFEADSGGETESEDAAESDKEDETDSQEESRVSSSLQWIDPKEELDDEATCEALVTSRKALYARQLIEKMEEMKLEEEIQQKVKRKCKDKYNEYMKQLENIYKNAEIQKKEYFDQRNKSLEQEETQLRHREEDDAKIIKKQEEEYSQYIAQESRKLLAIVEEAQRKEAEQASQRRALINQLQNSKGSFVTKISQMNQQLNDLQDRQFLEPSTESFLNDTLTHVSEVIDGAEQESVGQPDLQLAQQTLQDAIVYVDNLNANLKAKVEEKKKNLQLEEQRKAAKEAEEAAAAAQAQAQCPSLVESIEYEHRFVHCTILFKVCRDAEESGALSECPRPGG
ncbi:caldesmon-like [Penaeus indicus]|uniref:caldesmon-like n=1 Tax=Penaeus indicus TaxID=29960 RepID=UPI00300C3035